MPFAIGTGPTGKCYCCGKKLEMPAIYCMKCYKLQWKVYGWFLIFFLFILALLCYFRW